MDSISPGLIALKSELDGHAVQNEERRGPRVDRVRSADLEHGRLARFARIGDDRQTGSLSLQRLIEGRRGGIRELLGLDRGHGARDRAFLAHAVGDDDHVVERLGVALHLQIIGHTRLPLRNEIFHGLVTNVLEREFGAGGDLNRILSVRKGRDAARRAGNHTYPDKGLLVLRGGDYSANGDGFPPSVRTAAELREIANTVNASKLSLSRILCM